jgi:two-component system sporulation sensor kinase C
MMDDQISSIGISIDQFMRTEASSLKGKKAAHEFAEEHRPILDNFNDVIFITDEIGHFVFVNKASEQRTGIPTEKFIGRHFLELIEPKYHQFAQSSFQKAIKGEKATPAIEMERQTASGEKITLEVNWKILCENNVAVGFLGVCRDVTHRKRTEKKLIKDNEELEIRLKDHTEKTQKACELFKNAIIKWKRNEERMRKGYGD